MIVVIGAGPAGLYFVNKLLKAGVSTDDIAMYDPREGTYTRPGQLSMVVFSKIEQGLGEVLWSGHDAHIKDVERKLYEKAKMAGVKIEKKRFVRLQQDVAQPGIIVADGEDKEEFIVADYVFDCSGQARVVIQAVNRLCPDSPLIMEKIIDVPVATHFLAHVRMDAAQTLTLLETPMSPGKLPVIKSSLLFSRSLVKLRDLGWKHFKFPHCYAAPSPKEGSDKTCLYLQAPDNLSKENYDAWVQTVLECYIDGSVHYEKIAPSRKYTHKPRFVAFKMHAQALADVGYQGKNLPSVVALGDAQIDFNYVLGHGLDDGLSGIDLLFEQMVITSNGISVDLNDYKTALASLHREHKEAIINAATAEKEALFKAKEMAKVALAQASQLSNDADEKTRFTAILSDIESSGCYPSDVHHLDGETLMLLDELQEKSEHLLGQQLLQKKPLTSLKHGFFRELTHLNHKNTDVDSLLLDDVSLMLVKR